VFASYVTIVFCSFPFFCTDSAPSEIYTLSLHDALPIWLGVEEPEPLVAAGGVLDALGDRQRVVLREQVDRRRLLADQLLDLRVRPLAGHLVQRRAALVDQLVEPLDPRVVLADPAARLRVEERVEHGVGVE